MVSKPYATTGATKAFRRTLFKGTIPCIVCYRPAVGPGYDGNYYCEEHMREKYGQLIPVDAL